MRILKNVFYTSLFWLFATLLMNIPAFIIGGVVYPALEEWFPSIFPEINPVIDPIAYAQREMTMNLIFAIATVFIISYLCVRFDNERMEYMIRRTEGMYFVSEGAAIYYPRYLLSDLIVAITVSLPQLIGSLFLPDEIPEFIVPLIKFVFGFTYVFTDSAGYILGYIVMVASIFVSRLVFGITSLSSWRGVWLSEI